MGLIDNILDGFWELCEKSPKNNLRPTLMSTVDGNPKVAVSVGNLARSISPLIRVYNDITAYSIEEATDAFEKGDHIFVQRAAYQHHGIYDGCGYVYEYNDFIVQHASLRDFIGDATSINRNNERAQYSKDEIICRAQSRLGESEYNVVTNNCEHFAIWCRCGDQYYASINSNTMTI